MWDEGLALGILGRLGIVAEAAGNVAGAIRDSFYLGDPSRGTVYTSRQSVRQTAQQTAAASNGGADAVEKATIIGREIAQRLIESGVLNSPVIIDKDKVGEKVAKPVQENTDRDLRSSVAWRNAKGVLV